MRLVQWEIGSWIIMMIIASIILTTQHQHFDDVSLAIVGAGYGLFGVIQGLVWKEIADDLRSL